MMPSMLSGKELGAAIASAIEKKGVTQVAVAQHFGIRPPSVQDWIKRGTVSKRHLTELWAYFSDVVGPEHWGITDTKDDFIPVRRVDVKFSNGAGKVVYHMDDKPPLSFRADFLRKLGIAHGNAVVVDADGLSNLPKITDGSVVLVDCGDQHVNGDFFAFRDGDELLIKRLSTIDGVGVLATAENPDFKPKTKVYTNPDSFEIIGRCRWVGTEL